MERARLGIEIDEDEVEPFFEANRNEAEFLGIEIFDTIKFRGNEQSAVEAVGPAMVAAAEELAIAAAGGRIAGAMAADVIKAAKNAILAADDEKWLSDELERKVVAGISRPDERVRPPARWRRRSWPFRLQRLPD